MSEPHDVVKLLVARMESHPEEFESDGEGRWAQWLDELIPFTTEAERVLLRGPMMQDIHERVLDELMNGPDKRRKEKEEHEYERHLAASVQHMKQQQARQQWAQQKAQQNAYSQYQNAAGAQGLTGYAPTSVWLDESASIGNISVASQIEPTLSKSAINQIKQALGIKK